MLKNAKHEAVLQAYIANRERVGWKAYSAIYTNSSQRASEVGWSRLLTHAEFSARLAELEKAVVDKVIEKTGITVERVLAELALIGFSNMQDFAEALMEGDVRELERDRAAAVQEITVDTYMDGAGDDAREVKRVRLKLLDKRAALVDIGRHLKMFVDRHELTGKDGKPIETVDASEEKPSELEVARRIAFLLERAARLKEKPAATAKAGAKAKASAKAKPKAQTR